MNWQLEKFKHDELPAHYWVDEGEFCWESEFLERDQFCFFMDSASHIFSEDMYDGYEKLCLAVSSVHYEISDQESEGVLFKAACRSDKESIAVLVVDEENLEKIADNDDLFDYMIDGKFIEVDFTLVKMVYQYQKLGFWDSIKDFFYCNRMPLVLFVNLFLIIALIIGLLI